MSPRNCLVPLIVVVTSMSVAVFADLRSEKPDPKATDEIAWGHATNGLEAGIGFRPGEEHACRDDGSATFYIYLRNMSNKPVSFSYIETLFDEFVPTVEDDVGREIKVATGPINLGWVNRVSREMEPRETIRLTTCWFLVRDPGFKGDAVAPMLVAKPGKYQVYHKGFPIQRNEDNKDKQG